MSNESAQKTAQAFLLAFNQTGSVGVEKNTNGEDGDVLCVVNGILQDATLQFVGKSLKGFTIFPESNVTILRFKGEKKTRKPKSEKKAKTADAAAVATAAKAPAKK